MVRATPPSNPQPDPDEVEIQVQHLGDAPVPELEETAPPGPDGSAPAAAPGPGGAAPVQLFTVPAVTRTVEGVYAMAADRRGPHWRVTPTEAETIAEPLTGELNDLAQHFPGYGLAAGALGGRRMQLAAAVAIVTGPRLFVDYRLAELRRREANNARPEPSRAATRDDSNVHDPTTPIERWGDTLAGIPQDPDPRHPGA